MASARPRRWHGMARETLLTLAAILGAISVVAIVASFTLNLSVLVFKTGSMSPSIPAGAAAVTREIPAGELRVGDVASVHRPGVTLPITHRVVAIAVDPSTPGGVILTLKGDANPEPDPVTYPVTSARKVLWSVPGIGTALVRMRAPWVLIGMTLLVTVLVTWTFWPVRRTADPDPPELVNEKERR